METLATKKVICEMSMTKANHLFWLGRYAERVYITLHLLRKHFDLMIDEDTTAYVNFCTRMGIENKYQSSDDFMKRYLFDLTNPESVINMLEHVKDNAILLRDEIFTETLSYIEMSIAYMRNAEVQAMGIVALQPITDYILAFWGSIDVRISNNQARHTIKFGKHLESMELHMRFGYSFDRINEIFTRMINTIEKECYLCDEITLMTLKENMKPERYPNKGLIYLINNLSNA